jgi:tight adherence protein C
MLALFAALATFLSVALAVAWLSMPRVATPGERLRQLGTYPAPPGADASFRARVVSPTFGTLFGPVLALLPHSLVRRASEDLTAAGSTLTVPRFFAIVGVTGLVPPLFLLLLLTTSGSSFAVAFLVALALGGFGLILPFWLLRRRVQSQRQAILKSLPDALDLIIVSVEAGLGLDAALRLVAEKLHGPFSDQLGRMLREVGMGRARREALEAMAARIDIKDVTTLVRSIIQTEQLGTSLGRGLRAQATTIRVRRRQRAEEMSRKAPVKMAFPLVLFIMPSFFIVTIGPTFVSLVTFLQGK